MKERNTIFDGKYEFEVVDYVPAGYEIWNIIMAEDYLDYLPLCRLKKRQPSESSREVEQHTLKAIKIAGAQVVIDAIGGGQNTIEEMERYIKRYKNAKPGTWSYTQVQRMKKALPIMKQIRWE